MRPSPLFRRIHRFLAPIMVMPLLITLCSGVLFQIAASNDKSEQFLWLLDLHRGKFGRFNLELVYPYLNAIGLLTLLITGTLMWLRLPIQTSRNSTQ